MSSHHVSRFSFGIAVIVALAAAIGAGRAQTFSGPGASVPTNGTSRTAANTYPTTVTVGAAGTVATISVVLHNLVTDGNTRSSLTFAGLVLVAPSGKSMEIFGNMNGDGSDGGGLNLPTLTFQDGNGAVLPPNNGTAISPNNTPKKRKPTAFGTGSVTGTPRHINPATAPVFSTTPARANLRTHSIR